MSRCAKCNGLGYEHMTSAQVAAAKAASPGRFSDIPDRVIAEKVEDGFWRCPKCDKLYWEGNKFQTTRSRFWAIFETPSAPRGGGGEEEQGEEEEEQGEEEQEQEEEEQEEEAEEEET